MQERLRSIDVLRGIAVLGMILVNASAGMLYDNHATVYATLIHEHWDGLHLADTVFPAFLMLVGVAIPFSLGRLKEGQTLQGSSIRRILMRCFRLFLIGFLLSNLHWFAQMSHGNWRFWGVLQRIGIVYAACAMIFLVSGRRTWIIAAAVLLVGYWPLALLPQPDGQPTDLWVRGLNFVAWMDRATLGVGQHIYVLGPQGYDPEGMLSTLPAVAHGLIGLIVGDRLRRTTGSGTARSLATWGIAMLALGLAWGFAFPIVKDMWSSTFVLVTCGLTTLALAALHELVDVRKAGPRWFLVPTLAVGSNAIAAYMLHELSAVMLIWDLLLLPYRATRHILPEPMAALLPVLIYILGILWAMLWLDRKAWYIKV